jgi:SAM-dependent methyltransferase
MAAITDWKQRVAAHAEQLRRIQAATGGTGEDSWESLTPSFQADPRRTDDVELTRLLQEVDAATTLLDVGGGAGRFALPLALRCQHVIVVEPSASMGDSLRQLAADAGIANVSIVAQRWEEAAVEPADVVLCAHVVYTIADIQPFIDKLVQHARDKVVMPTHVRPPMSRFDLFWPQVHGEERQQVPGLAEFVPVLWEMDIYPQLEMFDPVPFRAFRTWERALETLRQRLLVAPDTEQDRRLQQAMHALLLETPAGYVIKGATPGRLALISWRPER